MITVASAFDIAEARRFQMALESADIPAFIPDEASAIAAPYFFIGSAAGVRVQVAEEHVPEAQKIIKTVREAHAQEKVDQQRSTRESTGRAESARSNYQDEPEERC